MDTLSIPFGKRAGHMRVVDSTWDGGPAVDFRLIDDARLIAREHIPDLIEWLQGFLEETAPPLPTLPHATIKAKLMPDGTERVLTLVEPYAEPSWVAYDEGMSADWFESDTIVAFEVLFPGIEA